MKKKYTKPQIIFESFTMNTAIAGDCEKIVGNPAKGTCGVPGSAPGENIFSSGISDCFLELDKMHQGDEADQYNGFCYHVPTEAYNFFNS